METREFRVEVSCLQRTVYHVAARDADSAKRKAEDRWKQGDASDVPGVDGCELRSLSVEPVGDRVNDSQDEELVLRFIREREKLLDRLGPDSSDGLPGNDAISAAQAARDLGWNRTDPEGQSRHDVIRAALALERLCAEKRLVCFERSRARQNERGVVRLYCTSEYLEGLTALAHGVTP